MSHALLKLQIGPVQEFIAQARSTRDLWSGSYLLSWLMAAGAKALVQSTGGDLAVVISPNLAGQPIYDFQVNPDWAKDNHPNDAILTPNFTNILVGWLPSTQAAAAVAKMVEAIRAERDAIADQCWAKLAAADLVDRIGSDQHERFLTQVKVFPAITWQITSAPPTGRRDAWLEPVPLSDSLRAKLLAGIDDFPAQITRNSWELDAVRALREFDGWRSGPGINEKDSLTGREEAVVGGKEWWRKRMKPLNDDAKTAVRSGKPKQDFLWPLLFREHQENDAFGAIQLIKRTWHWAYLTEVKGLEATHRREPSGKQFPFPSTPHLAIHDPAKNIREYQPGRMDAELEDEISTKEAHTAYFAVLALDGDHMGAWLGGENNDAGPTQEFRKNLSKRLSNFALHCVRPIVEACDGRLILAGGEDVLALLPADTAIDCARFLRLAYRGDPGFIPPLAELAEKLRRHHLGHGYVEPPSDDARKPQMSEFLVAAARETLFAAANLKLELPGGVERSHNMDIPDVSAGLAIAHYKEPLQDVVKAAFSAEKRAKNELDRGALAVTLVKHSGETVKWGCQWKSGGLELLDLIQRGRGEEVLSGRFPHRLVEVLSPYLLARDAGEPQRLQDAPGFPEKVDEIIAREFAVVLGRQSDSKRIGAFVEKHAPEAKLVEFLASRPGANAQARLRAIIGLCQVAAFIEPAVYSETFVASASPATS